MNILATPSFVLSRRFLIATAAASGAALAFGDVAFGQTSTGGDARLSIKPDISSNPFPVVPTTKILALGQFTQTPTPEQIKELFPKEVPATLRLYLAGKIDQWWIRQTQTGPVFLLNVTSLEEAHALMEKLPLGQAGLMKHEFIELGPLTPLHLLLGDVGALIPQTFAGRGSGR
jgi:hypothetical protein